MKTASYGKWDILLGELGDVLEATPYRKPKRPCIFCGRSTRALSGVCPDHADLPALDPHTNAQAGRFQRSEP